MSGWLDIIILGVLQGLTEFLPVSSSGHLAAGQMVIGLREGNLALSVTLHAGTLLATLVYFRQRLAVILFDLLASFRNPSRALQTSGGVDAKVVVLASLPTAAIGLALEPMVEWWTLEPTIVAIGFAITGLILLSTLVFKGGELSAPTNTGALLVGLAQGIAVLPGVSRSGATIVVLMALGVRSSRAFELSMLVSLPAVAGAFLLEMLKDWSAVHPVSQLAFGAAVAFGVGLFALNWLRELVTGGRLAWFAAWVLPLAVVVLLGVEGGGHP
jgi:undecaprenyl-diphosphatase